MTLTTFFMCIQGSIVVGLAYDCKENHVYWTDLSARTINRAAMVPGAEPEILVNASNDTYDPNAPDDVVVLNELNVGLGLLCRSGQSRGFGSGSQPQVDVLGGLQHRLDRDLQPGRQWEADSVRHRAGEPPGHHSCLLHWVIPHSICVFGFFVLCVFLKQTRAHTLFKIVFELLRVHQTDVMSVVNTGVFRHHEIQHGQLQTEYESARPGLNFFVHYK